MSTELVQINPKTFRSAQFVRDQEYKRSSNDSGLASFSKCRPPAPSVMEKVISPRASALIAMATRWRLEPWSAM